MRQKIPIGLRLRCCSNPPGMAKQVKTGYVLRYKKRIFGKDWREEYVVLYNDSTLAWFRDRSRSEPDGGLYIRDAPHMVAVGEWTSIIPYRPELPYACSFHCLMAFGTKKKDKVHWFLCKDPEEVNSWITAISKTLPPPPRPLRVQAVAQQAASAPPLPATAIPSMPTISQSISSFQMQPTSYPNHYPYSAAAVGRPLYHNGTKKNLYRAGRGGGDTPVRSGMSTNGMLTGALLTSVASGWGCGPRWGAGWGWGCGMGWGGGVLERSSLHYSDTDVHVNNYYDNEVSVINGDFQLTAAGGGHHQEATVSNAAVAYHHHHHQQQPQSSEPSMLDHGDDDFGGGDYDASCDGYDAGGFDFIF